MKNQTNQGHIANVFADGAETADFDAVLEPNKGLGLYIGGEGDVAVETVDGSEVTFVGLQAGTFLPVNVKVVKSEGTTATEILVLK